MLSREALRHAAAVVAEQAEALAAEFECGGLRDRGGVHALRLLAGLVRQTGRDQLGACGAA